MKKIFLVVLAFYLGFCRLASPTFAETEKVLVSNVQGNPVIVRDGREISASPGMNCQARDVLKTTPACMIDVAVNDRIGCRVLASSQVEIADAKEKITRLKLESGNIILNVQKLPKDSEFKVETPTAIAAVRGTQFWGRVEGAELQSPVTTFAVREGVVEIFAKNAGQAFTVNPGQALDIPKDAKTAPVIRPALAAELAAMEQAPAIKTSV